MSGARQDDEWESMEHARTSESRQGKRGNSEPSSSEHEHEQTALVRPSMRSQRQSAKEAFEVTSNVGEKEKRLECLTEGWHAQRRWLQQARQKIAHCSVGLAPDLPEGG